jgi:two-component system, LytTR family, response regulator
MTNLRVLIADDERPARSYLATTLREFENVEVVGEAENGMHAVRLIEQLQPDLALLDLQMPELDGFGVVRLVQARYLPQIAFVTAYDQFAVKAFEVNAVDYLLKPVSRQRLRETLDRVTQRLDQEELRSAQAVQLQASLRAYDAAARPQFLERIPVRHRDDIVIVPVAEIASVIADGELLKITTTRAENFVINYRLKDLEARLDPRQFLRLARGILANAAMITKVSPMPGGTYVVTLSNRQQLQVSRTQSRVLREQFLRL